MTNWDEAFEKYKTALDLKGSDLGERVIKKALKLTGLEKVSELSVEDLCRAIESMMTLEDYFIIS